VHAGCEGEDKAPQNVVVGSLTYLICCGQFSPARKDTKHNAAIDSLGRNAIRLQETPQKLSSTGQTRIGTGATALHQVFDVLRHLSVVEQIDQAALASERADLN